MSDARDGFRRAVVVVLSALVLCDISLAALLWSARAVLVLLSVYELVRK